MQLYKRASLLLSMGIMFIGILTFSTAGHTTDANTKMPEEIQTAIVQPETTPSPTATPVPTATPTPTPIPNDLKLETGSEISELVTNYLNAKLTCSYDELAPFVTDPDDINYEDLQRHTEAITGYSNIKVYTKRGTGSIAYKVYAIYDLSIASIDTLAPGLEDMLIQYDENGTPKVFYGDLTDEEDAYLTALNEDEDVQTLIYEVSDRLLAAIEADENLLELWQRIYSEAPETEETEGIIEGEPTPVAVPESESEN